MQGWPSRETCSGLTLLCYLIAAARDLVSFRSALLDAVEALLSQFEDRSLCGEQDKALLATYRTWPSSWTACRPWRRACGGGEKWKVQPSWLTGSQLSSDTLFTACISLSACNEERRCLFVEGSGDCSETGLWSRLVVSSRR